MSQFTETISHHNDLMYQRAAGSTPAHDKAKAVSFLSVEFRGEPEPYTTSPHSRECIIDQDKCITNRGAHNTSVLSSNTSLTSHLKDVMGRFYSAPSEDIYVRSKGDTMIDA